MDALEKKAYLNKINKALFSLDQVPLLRTYAPFDFEKFSEELKKLFSTNEVKVDLVSTKWIEKDDIKKSFSDKLNYLSFVFTPLKGSVYLLMDEEDISKLTNEILSKKKELKFSSSILQESYFRFLTLQSLNILNKMNLFQDLSPKIVEGTLDVETDALCLDFKIKINDISIFVRIAIDPTFRKSWEEYFSSNPPLKAFELTHNIELIMNAEIGRVKLNFEELKTIKNGDFVILDHLNFDPKTNKGEALLRLNQNAIFRAKIKQNKLKIIDFANVEEEDLYMPESNSKEPLKEPTEEEIKVENAEFPTKTLQEMPITVVVEAARFKITLDKLVNTQPGNLLDLSVHPERGVDLTVNGEKIATGELVQVGESLGVRITKMG